MGEGDKVRTDSSFKPTGTEERKMFADALLFTEQCRDAIMFHTMAKETASYSKGSSGASCFFKVKE
jgi:hypothetical protein